MVANTQPPSDDEIVADVRMMICHIIQHWMDTSELAIHANMEHVIVALLDLSNRLKHTHME